MYDDFDDIYADELDALDQHDGIIILVYAMINIVLCVKPLEKGCH